eukprot:TRINITY_DN1084_c0_g1_i8.p1 TRINITY_DN1084_c0_g1~~TRINITY_DN1084_c0_g1_i8.p1  ORF type:complete len:452 (-),score=42.17 TRINITY_DN1084_c0_g1_i8:334-1689(-)
MLNTLSRSTTKSGRVTNRTLVPKPNAKQFVYKGSTFHVLRQQIVPYAQVQGQSIRPQNGRSNSNNVPAFSNIERMIQNTINGPDPEGNWEEIEGCWVLRPPASVGKPEAVVHLLGGAFVGAAPQITYRLLSKSLAARNVMVITTPYATGFDHLRCVDEIQYKFTRCMGVLAAEVKGLPIYGVGHSLGSVLHVLLCSRYSVERTGNILMSYNNKPATDVIPFLSPLIAPGARMAGPILQQLATSPLRSTLEGATDALKGISPSLVKQLLPLLEQLTPIYLDVSQGRQEFIPQPDEIGTLIRSYYTVPNNLILKFQNDTLDQSSMIASIFQGLSSSYDVSTRTLQGDHLRPMQQAFVDLPPDVARVANQAASQGGAFVNRIAQMMDQAGVPQAQQPLTDLSKGMEGVASLFGGNTGGPITQSMQQLADEIALWMRVGGLAPKGTLPVPSSQRN